MKSQATAESNVDQADDSDDSLILAVANSPATSLFELVAKTSLLRREMTGDNAALDALISSIEKDAETLFATISAIHGALADICAPKDE